MAEAWTKIGGEFGQLQKAAVTVLETSRENFYGPSAPIFDLRDMMVRMVTNAGAAPADCQVIAVRFATEGGDPFSQVTANTNAKIFFDETTGLCGVLENASSTTTQKNAAVSKYLAMFRQS